MDPHDGAPCGRSCTCDTHPPSRSLPETRIMIMVHGSRPNPHGSVLGATDSTDLIVSRRFNVAIA